MPRYFARLTPDDPWREVSAADHAALSAMARGLPALFERAAFVVADRPPAAAEGLPADGDRGGGGGGGSAPPTAPAEAPLA